LCQTPIIPQRVQGVARPLPRRLEFLDGLRGIAALYVVFFHCHTEVIRPGEAIPAALDGLTAVFRYGHYAVAVFIVLSGFSLMLPIAGAADRAPAGGIGGYLKRRARRILPPYYAALALTLLAIVAIPGLQKPYGGWWDLALPALTPGGVLSHAALVHNLFPQWIEKINSPMWSVATEWQIYFLFPLVLLPVWRRFGNRAVVAVGFVIGYVPIVFTARFDRTFPWYVGLFALGMAAADYATRRRRHPYGVLAATLLAFFISVLITGMLASPLTLDPIIGLASACLIIHMTLRPHARAARVLGGSIAKGLGAFSYSLYLIHAPVIALAHLPMRTLGLAQPTKIVLMMTLGPAACVIAARIFYIFFERPFVRTQAHAAARPACNSDSGSARATPHAGHRLASSEIATTMAEPIHTICQGTSIGGE
jgi:peptidoglycan/LPS O-acetylase OafA/YrhL